MTDIPTLLPALNIRFKRAVAVLLLCASALGLMALATEAHAQDSGVQISSGTLSSSPGNGIKKWVSVDFESLDTGDHELTVDWDTVGADVQISVFDDTTGNRIGSLDYSSGRVVWAGALEQGGDYRVAIWVASGGQSDYVAVLSPVSAVPLSITEQPGDQTITSGENAVFTVQAIGGSGIYSYVWFANGEEIPGATSATLTLTALAVADSGTLVRVVVNDASEGSVLPSEEATLTVRDAPPTTSINLGEGVLDSEKAKGPRWVRLDFDAPATATHTVTVSWDTDANLQYRVRLANGTAVSPLMSGENPGVWQGELQEGESYFVGLWSTDGVANYTVTIDTPIIATPVELSIVTQPDDQTITEGEDASFHVEATGGDTYTYQWYRDNVELAGATGSELSLASVTSEDSGATFSVEVGNGVQTVLSRAATLTVELALAIAGHTEDTVVNEGSSAVLTVEAAGGVGSLSYQWYDNNDNVISGATSNRLELSALTVSNSGAYSVYVSDSISTVSATAVLTVLATDQNDDALARWTMNEPSGASVIIDSTGNGYNGTIGQDVVTGVQEEDATTYRWLFTPPTESYEPERIVNVPHYPELNPGSGNYSITMRYRTNVAFGNIVQKGQGGAAGGYWKIENPAGYLTCVFRGVANNGGWNRREVVSSLPLNDGEYHTITCERIDNTLRLIVDGVLDDTANNSYGSIVNDRPLSIGGKTNCNNTTISCDYFSGWIDEISISRPD